MANRQPGPITAEEQAWQDQYDAMHARSARQVAAGGPPGWQPEQMQGVPIWYRSKDSALEGGLRTQTMERTADSRGRQLEAMRLAGQQAQGRTVADRMAAYQTDQAMLQGVTAAGAGGGVGGIRQAMGAQAQAQDKAASAQMMAAAQERAQLVGGYGTAADAAYRGYLATSEEGLRGDALQMQDKWNRLDLQNERFRQSVQATAARDSATAQREAWKRSLYGAAMQSGAAATSGVLAASSSWGEGSSGGSGGKSSGGDWGYDKTTSDQRQKTDVQPADKPLTQLLDKLKGGYSYRYKDPTIPGAAKGERLGVMAQDLEKSPLTKHLVTDGADGVKRVNYGQSLGVVFAALAHLHKRVKAQEGSHAS